MSAPGSEAAVKVLAQSTPTPNQINEVARDLWCPLCSGVRLDNCELAACIQMKEVISIKLTEGESKERIKQYFLAQYGDVVLGMPSTQGFNLIAWILPVLAAVVALGWVVFLVRAWVRRRPAAATPTVSKDGDIARGDDYMRRVDDEMKRYE